MQSIIETITKDFVPGETDHQTAEPEKILWTRDAYYKMADLGLFNG